MVKKGLFLSLLAMFVCVLPALAQDIGSLDFRNLNAEELSNAQLRQINQEIQNRGLTIDQFEQLAIAQGGQQAQVRRLSSRLQEVRLRGEEDEYQQPERPTDGTRFVDSFEDQTYQELEEDSTEQVADSLQIFGMDLFTRVSMSFEPSFNIPTPRDYMIGPGDQLVIDVWGAAEQTYQLLVGSEGNIRILNLGPINVSGMTIEEASERIVQRLSSIYSGLQPNNPEAANTWASVSLGNVRSIKVTVMGEVKQPGTYTVSSLSTLFNALYAAGGPNEDGTFRKIQVLRGGELIHTFDIYDFLVHGNQEGNIRLRDQDIIKVDPYVNRVHVWGETKRVGFFETLEGETLEDLISYAAGFTNEAYTRTLTLHGRTPTMHRISSVLYPESSNIEIQNGDRLRVGRLLERYANRVTIRGAVFRPGDYELEQGMTLYDLIVRADGLREDASRFRGVIERRKQNLEREMLAFNVESVMEDPSRHDIPLRRDDVVRIASIFELQEEYTIRVSGAVNVPQTLRYRDNMTVEDAILGANGFSDEAAAYRVEVARRMTGDDSPERRKIDQIAETFAFDVDPNLGFRGNDGDFILEPFDQIYIRTKPNYQMQQTVRITGEVEFPGEYVISSRNARLSDLVEWAGGLSDYAYSRGASLDRILEVNRRAQITEIDYETTELSIIPGAGDDGPRVDTVRTAVGIRLAEALEDPESSADLILEPGDVVHIPRELQTVRVEGEVLSPTSVRYDPRRSFSDYLSAAGGVTEDAKRRRAYIVYANGEVDRTRRILFFRSNPKVEPGATIVVPREPDRREMTPQERISLASSIASTALLFITLLERLN